MREQQRDAVITRNIDGRAHFKVTDGQQLSGTSGGPHKLHHED